MTITERVPDDETDEHTEIGRVGHGAEHPARPRRRVTRRAPAQRGAHAALRRRRQPRAAHPARVDPRLLRAVAARDTHASSETTESALERIQAQSLRMTRLVEDLLLLARLDEGQELVYGTVDLSRARDRGGRRRARRRPRPRVGARGRRRARRDRRRRGRLHQVVAQPARQRPHAHPGGHGRSPLTRRARRRRMPCCACTTTARASTPRSPIWPNIRKSHGSILFLQDNKFTTRSEPPERSGLPKRTAQAQPKPIFGNARSAMRSFVLATGRPPRRR